MQVLIHSRISCRLLVEVSAPNRNYIVGGKRMEKYLHKMQPQSWEEKQFVDSNDTQAKEKSQCADSKILLQL